MRKYKFEDVLAAAKVASRWLYLRRYISGERRISTRAPDADTRRMTILCSFDYAKQIDVPRDTALRQLRKFVNQGLLLEEKRCSTTCSFRLLEKDSEQIGRDHIAELIAEGFGFEPRGL